MRHRVIITVLFTCFYISNILAVSHTLNYFEKVTNVSTLANGDKVIIVAPEDTYKVALSKKLAEGNTPRFSSIAITISGDKISDFNDNLNIFTLISNNGGWCFKSDDDYYLSSTSNSNAISTSGSKSVATTASISISIENGDTKIIFGGSDEYKYLRYSSVNNYFACYKDGITSRKEIISLFKLVEFPNDLTVIDKPLPEDAANNVVGKDKNGNYAAKNIVISDGTPFNSSVDFTAQAISYSRNFTETQSQTWQPFIVPFYMDIPEGMQVAELTSVTQVNGAYALNWSNVSGTLTPHRPYIILTGQSGNITFSGENKEVIATTEENLADAAVSKTLDGITFSVVGTYSGKKEWNTASDYVLQGGTFYHPQKSTNLKPFRIFLTITKPDPTPINIINNINGNSGDISGIEVTVAENQDGDKTYYDLTGRMVTNPEAGIYICNGEKVVIK